MEYFAKKQNVLSLSFSLVKIPLDFSEFNILQTFDFWPLFQIAIHKKQYGGIRMEWSDFHIKRDIVIPRLIRH